jgi:hypothetical protein
LIAMLGAALLAAGPRDDEPQPGSEAPGFHGMLVLGTDTIYISHLPMFVPQHRYQGIWKVTFGGEADRKYRAERVGPGAEGMFTLAPKELFRLPELTGSRTSFRADVFSGHFERGGTRILENVTVTLRGQVHWHPFRTSHGRPESITYVLFGDERELFLAHWISVSPNYDQVLVVKPSRPSRGLPAIAQFVIPGRSDDNALRAGESVAGLTVAHADPEAPVLLVPSDLQVVSEVYLEKGELRDNGLSGGASHARR